MEAVPSFREDHLATYYYDPETKEVELLFKRQINTLQASMLIELLAGAIIDISIVQTKRGES